MDFFSNIAGLGTAAIVLLAALAVGYVIFATFLSRWLSNAKRLRALQARSKAITRELQELTKAKAAPAELAAKQRELIPIMSESMKLSIKPLIILLPLTLILYDVVLPLLPIPKASQGTAQLLFFIILLGGGIVASIILYFWDKAQMKKEAMVTVVSAPPVV